MNTIHDFGVEFLGPKTLQPGDVLDVFEAGERSRFVVARDYNEERQMVYMRRAGDPISQYFMINSLELPEWAHARQARKVGRMVDGVFVPDDDLTPPDSMVETDKNAGGRSPTDRGCGRVGVSGSRVRVPRPLAVRIAREFMTMGHKGLRLDKLTKSAPYYQRLGIVGMDMAGSDASDDFADEVATAFSAFLGVQDQSKLCPADCPGCDVCDPLGRYRDHGPNGRNVTN